MDRRTFLGTVAGSLLAAPLAAHAQPAGKVPRIGYLWAGAVGSDGTTIEGLRHGLRELGYVEGQSIAIESRYGDGRLDRLPRLLHELIDLRVDVLVTPGTPVTAAAKWETRAIPIVSLSGNPLGSGFVESLARPGGNITGLSLATGEAFGGKWLELVKEAVPRAASVIVIWNPTNLANADNVRQVERVAGGLGLRVSAYAVRNPEDLDRSFALAVRDRVSACIVDADPLTLTHAARIVRLAAESRLPAIYGIREFVDAGGLISYGASVFDLWRRAATYVDKILKGAKPGDLPVEQPTKFELVINLKTAKALGLTIPQSLLLRADQVIE